MSLHRPIARAIFLGGLTVAALDALDALVFFTGTGAPRRCGCFRRSPPASWDGRRFKAERPPCCSAWPCICSTPQSIVAVYVLASRKLGILTQRPILCGCAYGLLVYGVMNYLVIPLSALTTHFSLPSLINGLIGHPLLVGVPSALFARSTMPSVTS